MSQTQKSKEQEELERRERELADDAVWKRIQRNTFTRWANNHINSVNKHIEDLEQDLSDGLRLISLIEVLSGKRINRFNKRPTVRAQKLENVGIALRFLNAEERIKLVNIDSIDLVDSNLKLILGLIWTLILHYSISTPLWENEEEELDEKGNKKKETPKHRLLRWINNKLPELRINNFTTDWNSGIALAALVDAIAPGLFPDWADLKKEDSLLIARKAMQLAEKWLSCPQLITPEDLVNPKVDDLSVMTYLSNFPNCKIKEDCPIKIFSRSNPNRVRVYHIKDTVCFAPTTFTVETFSAGEGALEVKILDAQNKEIPVNCVFNDDRSKTYTCTYTPKTEGQHKVVVKFNGKEVPKSPFNVQVQGIKGDSTKVICETPRDGQVNVKSSFEVDTKDAGLGQIEVAIIDLSDNKPTNIPLRILPIDETATEETESVTIESTKKQDDQQKISRRQQEQQPELVKPSQRKSSKEEIKPASAPESSPTKFRVEFVPQKSGPHQVQVKFAGENIPSSPFKVNFSPPCDLTKVKASGKGLWSLRVGDTADFRIFTEGAGQGKIQVYVQDPKGKNIPVEMRRIDIDAKALEKQKSKITTTQGKDGPIYSDNAKDGYIYECIYKPDQVGKYNVVIQYGEQEILRSPFEVNVSKGIDSKIIAFGPGLVGGIVNSPAVFTVDTKGEDSALAFSIEGPSQAKIECKDNGDGSALTSYLPTAPGEYLIHILSNNEDIPNSPYVSQILPRTDYNPELVKVTGKGVQSSGVPVKCPVKFSVDNTEAGIAPTEILVTNCQNQKNIAVKCEKRRRSSVDLAGQKQDKNESKAKKSKTVATIKQDSTEKKEGDIIDCEYMAEELGKHVVQVNFGGVSVPNSPFYVNVGEQGQPNKVIVSGPGVENGIIPKTKTHFNIDARKAGVGEISATVDELRNGKKVPINLINNGDDTYKVEYNVDDLSSYRVDVSLDGKSVNNMPITVRAAEPLNKNQIKIFKLNNTAYLNTPNTFLVDTTALKERETPIQVKCEVKSKSGKIQQAKVEKLEDGKHLVTFKPTEKGETQLSVLCDNQSATDQPLKVNVEDGFNEKNITVYGKNLKNGFVNQDNEFVIDTRNAGFANLNLAIEGPEDCEMTCTDREDGTFLCKYKPEIAGNYKIDIKFGNKNVPGNVFETNVVDKIDVDKVKLSGPGLDSKVLASLPTHIMIDSKDAGGKVKPDVEIKNPQGEKCKVKIEEKENGIYRVEYTPDEIGKYQVTCNFNSLPLPNNPISVNSVPTGNAAKCQLQKELEKLIKAGQENCVMINAKDAGKGNVTCKISNLSKPTSQQTKSNTATSKKDQTIKTSNKNKKVDKSEEISKQEEETIKVRVKDNKDGTFSVYYKVSEPGEYKMDLKFGGQNIPNGIHSFKVVEEEEETETTTTTTKKKTANKADEEETTTNSTKTTKKRTVIKSTESYEEETITEEYRIIELKNLPLPKITHSKKQAKKDEASLNQLVGIVKLPNGEEDKVTIIDNRNNTISVKYQPRQEGEHLLSITTVDDNEHIQGSPFRFYVHNPNSKNPSASGPGLTHGIAGEPAEFKVYTKNCGVGGLKISIEGPSKAIIDSQDDGDNTVHVRYIPPVPGEYRISIFFADKPINGSPFNPKITGEGKQRSAISVSGNSEIKLKITETFTKEDHLVATIITPNGTEENCYLKRIPETGHLLVSFTPETSGEHQIIVKKNNSQIFGSPFKINVLPTEIGNASLVKLSGTGYQNGKTNVDNTFMIDTRKAGYGALNLSIEGPSKCEISSTEVEPGLLKITYRTKNPGYYLMNLKYADQHVKGSPMTICVTGIGEQFQKETQTTQTKSLEDHQIGSVCKMSLTISQTLIKQKLTAYVTTPSGQRKEATLKKTDQVGQTHVVEFTATEIGEHIIEIIEEESKKNIPGFPIKFQVGKLQQDGGVQAVRAMGPALEGGVVGQKGDFNIYTRSCGSGSLSVTMEGPGKAVLNLNEMKDESGNFAASYLVDKPGEYRLAIKYADKHIINSPFRIWVMPSENLARKIVLDPLPSKTSATLNKTLNMKVNLNGVQLKQRKTIITKEETTTIEETTTKTTKTNQDNELIAKLVSPSGKEEDIFLTEIDENTCVLSFKCREPGPNTVNVRLNGVHVTNSPANFFVKKTKKEETKKTTSSTDITNKSSTLDTKEINTTNTTQKTNTSNTQNTQNVQNLTKQQQDTSKTSSTTKVTEKTEETTITCTKTLVKITGLSKEVTSKQENVFIVNTQNAPMGKLNVRCDGPHKADIKLALCDEGYKVSYTCNGPGKYFVQAKYNGQDITGFPYEVIVDGQTNTKRDLGEVKV